jgi:hypothetical protein
MTKKQLIKRIDELSNRIDELWGRVYENQRWNRDKCIQALVETGNARVIFQGLMEYFGLEQRWDDKKGVVMKKKVVKSKKNKGE